MALIQTLLAQQLGVRVPIIQAPMAGGPWTSSAWPPLCPMPVPWVSGGGCARARRPGRRDRGTRQLTSRPFAVNLFAPLPPPATDRVEAWSRLTGAPGPEFWGRARALVQGPARGRGGGAGGDDQRHVRLPVPGRGGQCGRRGRSGRRKVGKGAVKVETATTVPEAVQLERAGFDAVVAPGFEAGGHRGAFQKSPETSLVGTLALSTSGGGRGVDSRHRSAVSWTVGDAHRNGVDAQLSNSEPRSSAASTPGPARRIDRRWARSPR